MSTIAAQTLKRIVCEKKQMCNTPVREYEAYPLEDNALEWHFTLLGPEDSPYEGGLYHGRILLPHEYPFKPPDVLLLTPNGRFELNKKICLSVTSYHPEGWHPTWGIATVLIALRQFMLQPGSNGIGALELPADLRKKMALDSHAYECPTCKAKVREQWEQMQKRPPSSEAPAPLTTATPKSTPSASAVPRAPPSPFLLPQTSPTPQTPPPIPPTPPPPTPPPLATLDERAPLLPTPPPTPQVQQPPLPPAAVVAPVDVARPLIEPRNGRLEVNLSAKAIDQMLGWCLCGLAAVGSVRLLRFFLAWYLSG